MLHFLLQYGRLLVKFLEKTETKTPDNLWTVHFKRTFQEKASHSIKNIHYHTTPHYVLKEDSLFYNERIVSKNSKRLNVMKTSIQMKLLLLCIFLVVLTAAGISTTYYFLVRQDKQHESQQRIRIAFDIILSDVEERFQTYSQRFNEFLNNESKLEIAAYMYDKNKVQLRSLKFAMSHLVGAAQKIKSFGSISSIEQLSLYGLDKRLLVVYNRQGDQEDVGAYMISETGNDTYLSLNDPSELSLMRFKNIPIPDVPVPFTSQLVYQGDDIPDTIFADVVSDGQNLVLRVIAPVYWREQKIGALVGKMSYTQHDVEEYASLSKTEVNLFSGGTFSVGTLPAQTQVVLEDLSQHISCNELVNDVESHDGVVKLTFNDQTYYQGQCVLENEDGIVGAITVSLSQSKEKEDIKKILTAVLMVSGIAIGVAFVLLVLFSRRFVGSVQNIVNVIGAASEGDLRKTAVVKTHDEIGMLAQKLNQMILQLRGISGQVQTSSSAVNMTADTILEEVESLTQHMEQQSVSVENTSDSVSKINQFISIIRDSTSELLAAVEEILASIHESRRSRQEVTNSIGYLAVNVQQILASVEQVDSSAKHVSDHSGHLEEVVQQTGTEIQHIEHSLRDVSQNADRSQQLAKETMDAALSGQEAVETSIRGMSELKDVVAGTAAVIREVNSWGEQVSSILDIVDEIAEQTSLLALNASIISAQAGDQGKGFGVVADEIKELATRTKNSTKEISSLIQALQKKTRDGVKYTTEGIDKAEQGMQLSNAVKASLDTILERATKSSNRAASTAEVIQQTASSSLIIRTSMESVSDMVSQIRTAIQEQEQDISQVVTSVENIQGMSEQINQAGIEQNKASAQIEQSMELVTEKLSDISHQTEELKLNSHQIVEAMQTIESITEHVLHNTSEISGKTGNNLVKQSEDLQAIVNVFKVS